MSYTVDQIKRFAASDAFNNIPLECALEHNGSAFEKVAIASKALADLVGWKVARMMQAAFGVYGDALREVHPQWSVYEDGDGQRYAQMNLEVNDGRIVNPDELPLCADEIDAFDEIDDCQALYALVDACDNSIGSNLVHLLSDIQDVFNAPFSGAGQVSDLIASRYPRIEARLQEFCLADQTPQTKAPVRPRRM